MILMVSGRTDVVAFYSKWFINRYKAGFLDVRNPFYPKNVSRIYFSDVEAIMFCTKNPLPLIDFLPQINKPMIFHVTLTPYKNEIEVNVIDKSKIIDGIKKLSKIIGTDNLYIRYDPIFINDYYTIDYHIKAFNKLCKLLNGYVKKIIVSFIDDYKNVRNNMNILKIKELSTNDYEMIGLNFSKIALNYNMTVQTCAEETNLLTYGFIQDECLSSEYAFKLTNKKYKRWNGRKNTNCKCVRMVDVGEYNTCNHLCKYCYANFDESKINENIKLHNPTSSLLMGFLNKDDIIKIRKE